MAGWEAQPLPNLTRVQETSPGSGRWGRRRGCCQLGLGAVALALLASGGPAPLSGGNKPSQPCPLGLCPHHQGMGVSSRVGRRVCGCLGWRLPVPGFQQL